MVFDHPQGKEIFPNAQSEPSLVQLFAILILPLVPRSRAWHLPFLPPQELQRAVRSTLGLLFSRVDTLASLTQHYFPALLPVLLPSSGCFQWPYHFYIAEQRMACSIGETAPMQNVTGQSCGCLAMLCLRHPTKCLALYFLKEAELVRNKVLQKVDWDFKIHAFKICIRREVTFIICYWRRGYMSKYPYIHI